MSKQDYGTPFAVVRALESKLGERISFDLAASAHNTKHERYFTEEQNSLAQDWRKLDGLLWLNPPFADARPWVRKCKEESAKGARIASLTLASVGSAWFAEECYGNCRVLLMRPRIVFDGMEPNPKTGKVDPFMKDCMICIWDRNIQPIIELWDWSKQLAVPVAA